ncbi:amylo-alpha-16-glucosidase [miscellaneous Crenarchaeota group-15 archaeon DG-45]|uniref:beta-fructofuranosidase n=1 Tax=miscellaneous Crenarchaeota group-15 archaeon DG-45 TaxID=1685127 RepID=A0A0M0BTA3_9ARCH|nr:MAG: amylo-alpha-16-glucosidase [miscellaneous Crenarchaeota group-15 archaeon DG-45]
MNAEQWAQVGEAKKAALDVLLHNARGPYHSLPRTAGWGYPEPYTRDLLICGLGILACRNQRLMRNLRRVLQTLAKNQSRLGQVPGLVHDPDDLGTSDSTPLFLMIVGLYRKVTGEADFLEETVQKAMTWMEYQSPSNPVMVAQMPTSDWRDELWVLGYGLYVNTLVYSYLLLHGKTERASRIKCAMNKFTIHGEVQHRYVHEGLALRNKPYYAVWVYKVLSNERFDLLGNSLAILSGLAFPSRAKRMVSWIERECQAMREQGQLALDLPPNFFPYIHPDDPDWYPRYDKFNLPGEYLNGGIWPFVCGFYIAAIVATGRFRLAEKKLIALTKLVRPSREADVDFGFNEWFRAQDGTPRGQDWQSWSAAMYLYSAISVEQKRTPFFDEIRNRSRSVI